MYVTMIDKLDRPLTRAFRLCQGFRFDPEIATKVTPL